ncbi:hypothetical protein PIB30_041903 [Stylosanthes scabra]|uniref:Uncharacterized protein n=1 Tax=Stylosanthes scabra TaxID=79078 RepID=A0ABU6ZDU3_9FABA|nr:hypothetical protein [Stylosanthes scabra]
MQDLMVDLDKVTTTMEGNSMVIDRPNVKGPQANLSNVLATLATVRDPNWYLDSSATHQMISDQHNLTEKDGYEGTDEVIIGNCTGN